MFSEIALAIKKAKIKKNAIDRERADDIEDEYQLFLEETMGDDEDESQYDNFTFSNDPAFAKYYRTETAYLYYCKTPSEYSEFNTYAVRNALAKIVANKCTSVRDADIVKVAQKVYDKAVKSYITEAKSLYKFLRPAFTKRECFDILKQLKLTNKDNALYERRNVKKIRVNIK
jgi:hypothetical protein